MTDVSLSMRGPIRMLLVNATGNRDGFEDDLANDLRAMVREYGYLPDNCEVLSVQTISGLRDALAQDDWNVCILVAHGGPAGTNKLAVLEVGADGKNWYELKDAANLEGRGMILAVCSGANIDSEFVIREMRLAWIVGSPVSVNGRQVRDYARQFLDDFAVLKDDRTISFEKLKAVHAVIEKTPFTLKAP